MSLETRVELWHNEQVLALNRTKAIPSSAQTQVHAPLPNDYPKISSKPYKGGPTFEAEAGEAVGESETPFGLLRLRRDMPGRLCAPEGGMAPAEGLKAGMESDSARLEAMERLGEDMPPRLAASSSICSIAEGCHHCCELHA